MQPSVFSRVFVVSLVVCLSFPALPASSIDDGPPHVPTPCFACNAVTPYLFSQPTISRMESHGYASFARYLALFFLTASHSLLIAGVFQPLNAEDRLSDRAFEALFHAIFNGVLPPGAPLKESDLKNQLGVSQWTVHEALLRLEVMGLVHRESDSIARVTSLEADAVRQRMVVRRVMEREAFANALKAATPAHLASLRKLAKNVGHKTLATADLAFHRQVWKLAGNLVTAQLLDRVTAPLFLFEALMRRQSASYRAARTASYQGLVDALQAHDSEELQHRLQDHILGAYDGFLTSGQPDALSFSRQTAQRAA